jgi:ketosteroid isomerase-like protein
MTQVSTNVTEGFVEAIIARDFPGAQALLHREVDFRGMTPKRMWDAEDPAGVEEVLRAWFEHPDRDVERVEPTEPTAVADTVRVGWRVYGTEGNGKFVFEQQAFLREEGGKVVWMRVMCSGPRAVSV